MSRPRIHPAVSAEDAARAPCFRGVSWKRKRWEAQIWCQGRSLFLGSFASAEDAARAYDRKARELRGPQAPVNFPEN